MSKVVLITGASSGIGKAIATFYLKKGIRFMVQVEILKIAATFLLN